MERTPGGASAEAVETQYRILLVEDDDLDMMEFMRHVAACELPIEMQRARNAVEAMEMLRLQEDAGRCLDRTVLVLDLNMPAMDGLEFLAELRADPELRSTVVFAFTTSAAASDIRKAYEHHVAGYVVKDVVEDSTARLLTLLEHYFATVTLPCCGHETC